MSTCLRAAPTAAHNPRWAWGGGTAPAGGRGLAGEQAEVNAYWVRVWGARGLLHCYDDLAARDVVAALSDEAWRVREMAAKVVGRWEVGEAAEALEPLLSDDVPRVRTAAGRGR